MADLHVTEELQDYLVAQNVAQLPSVAPSLTLPSVWLQGRGGGHVDPRRTGDDGAFLEKAAITIVDTALSPPQALEAWIDEAFIDIVVRSRSAPEGRLLLRTIRGLLHPISAHGGRKMWQMGDLLVEYSTIWTSEQPLGSDNDTFWRKAGYRFGVRRKVLAGLPYP